MASSTFADAIGIDVVVGCAAGGWADAVGKYTDFLPSFQSGGPGVFSAKSGDASANTHTLSAMSLIARTK